MQIGSPSHMMPDLVRGRVKDVAKFLDEFKESGVVFEGGSQAMAIEAVETAVRKSEQSLNGSPDENTMVDALSELQQHVKGLIGGEERK
jgi:hypothetical protein